jgi:hypothetical protein
MSTVTIEREALQTVLEALESCDQVYGSEGSYQYFSQAMVDKAITVAKQALAAQRQWTGLTDEDVYLLANEHLHYQTEGYKVSGVYNLARAIEAKLKEKNHG